MRRLFGHLSGIIIFFILIIISSFSVKAIGVQPLTMDFSMSPGESEDFQLIFSSSGIAENVRYLSISVTRIIPAFWDIE